MAKSADAFRTISEVAEWLDTPSHVLRFWESKFPQIKPIKRAGGRRYYRPADMELIGGIKNLLHEQGMTIKGVQKILREQGVKHVSSLSPAIEEDDGALVSAHRQTTVTPEAEEPDASPVAPFRPEASEPPAPSPQTAAPVTADAPGADDVPDDEAQDDPEDGASEPAATMPSPGPSSGAEDADETGLLDLEDDAEAVEAAETESSGPQDHNEHDTASVASETEEADHEATEPEGAVGQAPVFDASALPDFLRRASTGDSPSMTASVPAESGQDAPPAEATHDDAASADPDWPAAAPAAPAEEILDTPAAESTEPTTEDPGADDPQPVAPASPADLPKPLGADIPDDPDEATLSTPPGPLGHLSAIGSLSADQARAIRPLVDSLRARMG